MKPMRSQRVLVASDRAVEVMIQMVRDYSGGYEPYRSGPDQNAGVAEYREVCGSIRDGYGRTVSGSDVLCYGGYRGMQ